MHLLFLKEILFSIHPKKKPEGKRDTNTYKKKKIKPPYETNGAGNGNPLKYSCLENPRDVGAWWAALHGVTQSQTWLEHLSSSSKRPNWDFLPVQRLTFCGLNTGTRVRSLVREIRSCMLQG